MNKQQLFFYRLYIVVGILGIIIALVFAFNGCESERRLQYKIETEHSKLVPLNDTDK
jgi:hypothetical protein